MTEKINKSNECLQVESQTIKRDVNVKTDKNQRKYVA